MRCIFNSIYTVEIILFIIYKSFKNRMKYYLLQLFQNVIKISNYFYYF